MVEVRLRLRGASVPAPTAALGVIASELLAVCEPGTAGAAGEGIVGKDPLSLATRIVSGERMSKFATDFCWSSALIGVLGAVIICFPAFNKFRPRFVAVGNALFRSVIFLSLLAKALGLLMLPSALGIPKLIMLSC